jgi:hypothetical protein
VNFFITAVESLHELVDVHAGCSKLFSGDGSMALHSGHETVGDSVGDVTKFVPSKADESFSRSRGKRGVWSFAPRLVCSYMEWRWHDFLNQRSGGVRDVLNGWSG